MEQNNNPLITIVTPSYNQGQFIEETILSVLNQTYKNIQYIVVDGGSIDQTMDVVNKYKYKIDIIIDEKDNGQTDAINKGFKLAKGELVGWINSDDILYPDCVKNIVDLYYEHPEGAVFYNCYNDRIDVNSNKITTYSRKIPDRNFLLNNNYNVIQQASFYKLSLVKKVNYLDASLNYCMDLDLWLRLLNWGPIVYSELGPASGFRVWENTKTTKGRCEFFREIRKTLLANGANFYSKNIRRTIWFEFKDYIKKIIFK